MADQSLKAYVSDLNTLYLACELLIDVGRDDPVLALRVLPTKCEKVLRIELAGGPLAFDGVWSATSPSDDKIDLVLVLVSPVVDLLRLQGRLDFVQYEVLPQET